MKDVLSIKSNCPNCYRPMAIKRNRQNDTRFLGCSGYPDCTYTKPLPESVQLREKGYKELFDDIDDQEVTQ